MPTALKFCPFCGESRSIRVAEYKGIFFVVCDTCHADGPAKDGRADAIQAWNTRRPRHDGDGQN